MFWCYPGQQERVCLRRGGGTRESTRRCVRRACGACAAQNCMGRSRKTTRHPLVVFTGSWPRARAPLSPLAFFLDSTELYVYLCTVVHTSVRIPLYSTRPTISLIVQQKKLSTSNKPITHYNVHCRLCRTGTPNRNTVERKTVRIHIRNLKNRTDSPTHAHDHANPRCPPSGRPADSEEPTNRYSTGYR